MQVFYLLISTLSVTNGFLLYSFLKNIKKNIDNVARTNITTVNHRSIAAKIMKDTEEEIYNAMKYRMQYKMFKYYTETNNGTKFIDVDAYDVDDDEGCGCSILDNFEDSGNKTIVNKL